jgi:hypothetical protein
LYRDNAEGMNGGGRLGCVLAIGESMVVVGCEDDIFAGRIGGEERIFPFINGGEECKSGAVEDGVS